MNKILKEKLCIYINKFLDRIPHKLRRENKILQIFDHIDSLNNPDLTRFFDMVDVEYVFFGEWGECGMAVFLNGEMSEVFRVAFEEGKAVRSWFITI